MPTEPADLPLLDRTYRSWCIDSTRWQNFTPRAGDVVVVTPYKSGTTWMLNIVGHLTFNDLETRDLNSYGRWLDAPWTPIAQEIADLEAMTHRRVLKSHLALDGIPYDPMVRYIYVGRDLRDIFMSLWNHHNNYTPELWEMMSAAARSQGLEMPTLCPDNIREFYSSWISRGWFEGANDGYPYWSTIHHLRTWWAYRHLPNILFVHFNDLRENLNAEISRVARFLGHDYGEDRYADVAAMTSFTAMKRDAAIVNPGAQFGFRGGSQTFINKGTNERWRDVLTEADLERYYDVVERELPADAAAWLELGQIAN